MPTLLEPKPTHIVGPTTTAPWQLGWDKFQGTVWKPPPPTWYPSLPLRDIIQNILTDYLSLHLAQVWIRNQVYVNNYHTTECTKYQVPTPLDIIVRFSLKKTNPVVVFSRIFNQFWAKDWILVVSTLAFAMLPAIKRITAAVIIQPLLNVNCHTWSTFQAEFFNDDIWE